MGDARFGVDPLPQVMSSISKSFARHLSKRPGHSGVGRKTPACGEKKNGFVVRPNRHSLKMSLAVGSIAEAPSARFLENFGVSET